jgi:zinc and cadmium transporter
MNLIGDAVHNFVDGVLIAGSFIADPWLGMTTTAAILVHELPQEIGDVGALIHGGYAPRQAILWNFVCSLTVLAGVLFTLLLGQWAEASLVFLLPIAAGGFIYITASDFIPSLHDGSAHCSPLGQTLTFAAGIGCMQGIVMMESVLSPLSD